MSGRENWGSRLGFIMAAAGSAVGLGNIWRFPYMTGTNGGAAFLLIYLGIVLAFGLSLAMAEMTLGRAAQRNAVGAYRMMGGARWGFAGYVGIVAGFMILSFYIVVAGWTLAYVVMMARGLLGAGQDYGTIFGNFVGSPVAPIAYAGVFMLLTALVVIGGISRGIERWNKVLMPALFVLLLILVARSLTLPGAGKGVEYYLVPDFSEVNAGTFRAAVAQAFFSLSIGMGTMLTYGSYLPKTERIPSAALMVVLIDTSVAIIAGLMVLPAVFAYGLNPGEGPGLTFVTLPAVFAAMPFGVLFGILFFVLLAIAALTSAVSLLEPMICYVVDERRVPRARAVWIASAICFALGIPASLSFGAMADLKLFGRNWFDLMDFLSNTVMLPVGGLLLAIFMGWFWSKPALAALSNEGTLHQPWAPLWIFVLRFVAPVGIAWILLAGLF